MKLNDLNIIICGSNWIEISNIENISLNQALVLMQRVILNDSDIKSLEISEDDSFLYILNSNNI